jgi:hypothetical protein
VQKWKGKTVAELSVREVLEQEAEAIHGLSIGGTNDLYRKLNEADRAALCLSGGGIRSAAFALGIIQVRPGIRSLLTTATMRPV